MEVLANRLLKRDLRVGGGEFLSLSARCHEIKGSAFQHGGEREGLLFRVGLLGAASVKYTTGLDSHPFDLSFNSLLLFAYYSIG